MTDASHRKYMYTELVLYLQTLRSDRLHHVSGSKVTLIKQDNIASPHDGVIMQNDIGFFTGAGSNRLSTESRLSMLQKVWVPDRSFQFPVGKRNLKFQRQWLDRWQWLCYSKERSGAFCKFCVLFSPCGGGVGCQPLGRLVTNPLDSWKDAVEEFNRHANTSYLKTCVLKADNLISVSASRTV